MSETERAVTVESCEKICMA